MIRKKKTIADAFNKDIKKSGRYQYANFERYSVYHATKRQTDEIVRMLRLYADKNSVLLDVGCGDGTFTFEISKDISYKKIVGFDIAKEAIKVAQKAVKKKYKKKILFQEGSIYNAHKIFKKDSFDIIVVRGVLHHLDNPQKGIKALSLLAKKIIVLEPNGYNPLLKLIEKISPYHIEHNEKSYWPPTVNKWFIANHYQVKEQEFISIIPYFCPEMLARILKTMQPIMEKVPYIKRLYCGTNVIYYER